MHATVIKPTATSLLRLVRDLRRVSTYKIMHDYDGLCPNSMRPESLDPDCRACAILARADRVLKGKRK
jgi:hypothetical protein